ncbi:MAG: type II toxin-antitoxin system VapC family toxin [Bacteroidetes bacterium]|nr:type II toxin-antitoxin system VapC family toxin [Bacteroidota bacterium]
MKIFLDTSSLVKLYHQEAETNEIEQIFKTRKLTHVFLSEISKIEFASAIWKKVRSREISETEAKITLDLFASDFEKYTFVSTDSLVLELARIMISKYGNEGLRTLDSIQLATSCTLIQSVSLFITSDTLLKLLFKKEGLPTE